MSSAQALQRIAVAALIVSAVGMTHVAAVAKGSAGGSGHGSSHSSNHHGPSHKSQSQSDHRNSEHSSGQSHHPSDSASAGVKRDSHGRIERSQKAKTDFKKQHPCPSTGSASGACPGYVIDHKVPLKRGGKDDPSNMQWQSKEEARAKDKWE